MDRRQLLLGASALGASVMDAPKPDAAQKSLWKPLPRKVLLIDLDDLGRKFLSDAVSLGWAPNLATAKSVGRSYQNFWAALMCSPFRARVLTGLEAFRPGNLVSRIVTENDTFTGPTGTWLPAGLPGLKVKLGKWHLSCYEDFAVGVALGGYDSFVGVKATVETYYSYEQWFANALGSNSVTLTTHQTTRLAADVLAEIDFGTDLIHASFCAIHTPLALPPNDEPPGQVYTGSTEQQIKHAMLYHLDYWLGQIFAQAMAKGYVIIVTCDNGTDGDGKGLYFEAGPNTDLIILGYGVKPGSSSRLVQATDLWATVRRLRGDVSGLKATDSLDFTDDFLFVPPIDAPRQILRLDWSGFLGVPTPPENWSRMVRDHRWKYVHQTFAPKPPPPGIPLIALHDLQSDPNETVNLLDSPLSTEAQDAYDMLLASLPQ
jgi:arylsulfatase A-like enzyme